MYVGTKTKQVTFYDFNQGCGMQLDSKNEWVKLADSLDWEKMETKYAELFPTQKGRPAKSFRMALGALIIQKRKVLSDRKLLQEIEENPYLQYFIGLDKFEHEAPFSPSLLVTFRKRINHEFISEINEMYLAEAKKRHEKQEGTDKEEEKTESNEGTAILDATCSPSNIAYPQDFALLSKAREKLEEIIDVLHKANPTEKKPRTYRRIARKEYLALAKSKKRTDKQIRAFIRKHLGYVLRDIGYIDQYLSQGAELPKKYERYLDTIRALYDQQKYMYDNKVHSVENRIVSISQPWIRPIVRGKTKAPVEFGAKYDVSIDEDGYARLEKASFDPYNENTTLQAVIEKYKERTGHYPERALVDKIYRTRDNLRYCKEHGIQISGPRLGRPRKDAKMTKTEYKDNTDRIEVERFFSLTKRCYGAGLVMTKLDETSLSSIAMSIFAANLFHLFFGSFFLLLLADIGEEYGTKYLFELEPAR